ncbi:MAG: PAS domain S-box protein [Rhodospirillales bacterium]|jgi:PAS domain S-box-containing protein|nr:PAS domain S-box protein [Rhodospirillales bacterium]
MKFGLRGKLVFSFGLLALISISNFGFLWMAEKNAAEQQASIWHTHQVITESESFLGHLRDAETGQRGFLLTGQPEYLEPYHLGIDKARSKFRSLRILTRDNSIQQSRLDAIEKDMAGKLDELGNTILLAKKNKRSEALAIVNSDEGKKKMDAIRTNLQVFKGEEERLLELRKTHFAAEQASMRMLFIWEAVGLLFLIIVIALVAQRKLVTPVIRLTGNTQKLAAGENVADVEVSSGDEMGQLVKAFNSMVRTVNSSLESLAQAQKETEEKEQRLSDIIWSTNIGTWEWNIQTDEISFNERWAGIIGYTLNELEPIDADTWRNACHPDDLKLSLEQLERHFSGELNRYECETRRRHKDGSWVWVLDRGKVVEWTDDGKPLRMSGTNSDISKRKKAEDEIDQFKTTLDRTQDCIFMFRPDTLKFFYVNHGAIEQVGYSESELFEMAPFQIKPEYNEEEFRNMVQSLIDGPQHSTTFETLHENKDGTQIPVEIFLQFVAPTDEEPRFVAIVRDITERRRVDRAKAEFISTVSHELRTPLTSIKGSIGLIKSGAAGELPDELKSMLNIAYNNSDRLVLLINDILDMEKIEAGKMSFHMKPVEVLTLVDEAIEANKGYGDEQGVAFVRASADEQALVVGDRDRLMQVLSNLMSNAAKFSPQGEDICLSVVRHKGAVRIGVQDKGPGIPEEFRANIFEKFSQADSSDTRKVGGTGLGLSITRAIVDKHAGSMSFETETGKGSTFFVNLPELAEQGEARPLEAGGNGNRILICEDEIDVAAILEGMLAQAGFQTAIARTSEQAKRMLETGRFDAMTLDLGLPDQDGISLIQELRKNPGTHNLPVIVVSATASDGKQELNGDAIGVIDWIEKPIDQKVLVTRLSNALRHLGDTKPRILHVEDDENVLRIVSVLVDEMGTVTAAKTLREARALMEANPFDLVILDLMLPDGKGETLLPFLNRPDRPSTPVIVFSAKDISRDTAKSIEVALIKTQTSNDELLNIIRSTIAARNTAA